MTHVKLSVLQNNRNYRRSYVMARFAKYTSLRLTPNGYKSFQWPLKREVY